MRCRRYRVQLRPMVLFKMTFSRVQFGRYITGQKEKEKKKKKKKKKKGLSHRVCAGGW